MDSLIAVILATALAAGFGAVARHLATDHLNTDDFPIGTLLVNLTASFAFGIIIAAPDPAPTVVGIGALGAFSTWAVPANEAAAMSRSGNGRLAVAYLGLTVSSGILMAWFGIRVGSLIW